MLLTEYIHDTMVLHGAYTLPHSILPGELATPQSHLHVQPTWQDGSELQLC